MSMAAIPNSASQQQAPIEQIIDRLKMNCQALRSINESLTNVGDRIIGGVSELTPKGAAPPPTVEPQTVFGWLAELDNHIGDLNNIRNRLSL